jgi:iron complex transport system permease protein/cobaltochelatase CobN
MMILVGIGMMYLFSSVTTLIKFNANEEALHEIYIWSLGTLSKVNWTNVVPLVATAIIIMVGFTFLATRINILASGDKVAQTLGINPVALRIVCFSLVSIGVAVVVRYTGTIGFVGLVAPHITRLFMGNNNKLLIPVSAIAGAMLILVGDIIVRMLPGGLPAGVITALIGSPMFLYFLFRNRMNKNF